MKRLIKPFLLIALLLLLFMIPLFIDNLYYIGVLTKWWINILLVASFWLIMSTGQVNLGHAAFAAIGGYMSAALIKEFGWNSWASLPVGVVTAGLVALVIGFITLRITGIYFIITTIALIFVVQIIFGVWVHPFGGLVGISGLAPPAPLFSIHFSSRPALYYLTLILMLLGVLVVYRVYHSSIGRVFRGINSSDRLAEHVGINIMNYKVLAFVIGCMCAGLAGVLYTYDTGLIKPGSFTLTQSTYYIVYAAVGGLTYFPGPIIGMVTLGYISEVIKKYALYENIIFALLLIGAMLFFKEGLYGLYRKAVDLVSGVINKKRPSRQSPELTVPE